MPTALVNNYMLMDENMFTKKKQTAVIKKQCHQTSWIKMLPMLFKLKQLCYPLCVGFKYTV